MDEFQIVIQTLIGDYGWMIITGLVALIFKSAIENAFYGLKFMIGTEYDVDDIVTIKDRKCRIVRQGIFRTTFYTLEDNSKFHISNNKLQNHIIEKQLPKE